VAGGLTQAVSRCIVPSLTFAVLFVGSGYCEHVRCSCGARRGRRLLIVLLDRQEVRVRLKEVDAPELKQPFGKRSRQSLTDLCAKKEARVSWTEKDRNGRTLGQVWCGGIDANTEQVRRGMAWVPPWEWQAKGSLEYRAQK
jgi:endonuclease YncB( thermonuclease family)